MIEQRAPFLAQSEHGDRARRWRAVAGFGQQSLRAVLALVAKEQENLSVQSGG
jgi:hypothetical protein